MQPEQYQLTPSHLRVTQSPARAVAVNTTLAAAALPTTDGVAVTRQPWSTLVAGVIVQVCVALAEAMKVQPTPLQAATGGRVMTLLLVQAPKR